jgi:gas vesicle protein
MSNRKTSSRSQLIWAALAGGAVGGLLGVLMAPAAGDETRNRIARRIGEGADSLLRKGQEAMEHAGSYSRRAS